MNLKLAYLLDSNALSGVTTLVNTGMKKCSSACMWKRWRCSAVWETWGCPVAHAADHSPHSLMGICPCHKTPAESDPCPWIIRIAISSFPQSREVSKIVKELGEMSLLVIHKEAVGTHRFCFKYPVEKVCVSRFSKAGNNVEEAEWILFRVGDSDV